MRKTVCFAFAAFAFTVFAFGVLAFAARAQGQGKLSPRQMKEDAAFLEDQLFRVHANPFTELSRTQYERLFDSITAQCTDSLSPVAFRRLLQPTLAYLSDEHAHMSMVVSTMAAYFGERPLFLPFTLTKKDGQYYIDHHLAVDSTAYPAAAITHINGMPIATVIARCALYSYGFPDQRAANALRDFGYLFGWSRTDSAAVCTLRFANQATCQVRGVTFQAWQNKTSLTQPAGVCPEALSYRSYGATGYIQACSFNVLSDAAMDSLRNCIADIFRQIRADNVHSLVIDVSRNGGGNSSVGDAIIGYITARPYRDYQCYWKRSDEYLKLLQSWGFHDDNYASQPLGKVLHIESSMVNPPRDIQDRFTGKVYVLVGNGTFSSAIQFATVIKDNHIATLIGETPQEGHPNHFGELYSVELPHSGLSVRFGVKEWIRPAGKTGRNVLEPDIPMSAERSPEEIVAYLRR
jgi:hypothetical protein